MKKCPSCGHESAGSEIKCTECGSYYSRIIELIDEEAADEEKNSFRGRCRRILKSGHVKHELMAEIQLFMAGLTFKAKFTLFVILVFVFALVVSVL